MIGKGKSISHGVAALEYDLAKEIDGQAAATEIARHELYGCTGAEMVQEMKPYFTDFPNVKNNCLRFEVSPSIEESSSFTDADWAELGNDFMQRMGLMNHQYIIIKHSGTESKKKQAHLHILANRISLSGELYRDNWIGKRATEAANAIAKERDFMQSQDIGKANKAEIKEAMNEVLRQRLHAAHGTDEPPVHHHQTQWDGEQEETGAPAYTGKPDIPFRGTLPGQLDRETGNGSRQRHSQGTGLCAVAGHRKSQ